LFLHIWECFYHTDPHTEFFDNTFDSYYQEGILDQTINFLIPQPATFI